jgi:multisubunit Na+/H+ antiporter MnhF subunit
MMDFCLVTLSAGLLVGSALLSFWRFWRGPHLADRIVALDQASHTGMAFLLMLAMGVPGSEAALTTWLFSSAVSFVGVWALALWMEESR